MNTTTIRFLKAGMVYLLLGGFLGVLLSLPVTRTALYSSHPGARWGVAHAHIVLTGFVMMTIFGIAYHILPRFAGKPLHSEGWAAAHFWLAAPATAAMAIGFAHAFAAPLLWAGGAAQFEEPAYPGAFAVTEPNEPHGLKAAERTVMLAVIAPRP